MPYSDNKSRTQPLPKLPLPLVVLLAAGSFLAGFHARVK